MNWTAIHAWLYTGSFLGIHRVAWAIMSLGLGAELLLGKSKNPQLRSITSAVATAIEGLVTAVGIAKLPLVGPLVLNVLKAVDGSAGVAPPVTSQSAASPPPPPDPPKAA
jgi:hypothetical protein